MVRNWMMNGRGSISVSDCAIGESFFNDLLRKLRNLRNDFPTRPRQPTSKAKKRTVNRQVVVFLSLIYSYSYNYSNHEWTYQWWSTLIHSYMFKRFSRSPREAAIPIYHIAFNHMHFLYSNRNKKYEIFFVFPALIRLDKFQSLRN